MHTEDVFVEFNRFDEMTRTLATDTTRRRAISALGALALGGAGILSLTQDAAADKRRKCLDRCNARGGSNRERERRDRCRRRCENR
jgi:hypothetical protein